MTPWPLVVGIMAPIAGRLSDRYPAGILGGLGLALLGVGMALLAMLPASPLVVDIVWRMAICGCGFGFFQAPNMKALMSSAPAGRSGGASGMVAGLRAASPDPRLKDFDASPFTGSGVFVVDMLPCLPPQKIICI